MGIGSTAVTDSWLFTHPFARQSLHLIRWRVAGVRLRDKAILLLAHELQPRLDPTAVAARIESTLHAAYHLRGEIAAEQAKRGVNAMVSRAYAETMQDRWTRLQSDTGCLIRSQLLDGAYHDGQQL